MTHILNEPFGAQPLCNVGTGIIKVKPPDHGDDTRTFGPYVDGQSLYCSFISHGKESIVLDLKNDHGRSTLVNMFKQVDVLAEDFCPDTMEKLGFSWETPQEINSCLIYASLSGLGHISLLKDAPIYDTIIQAMSGIMMETGYSDAPPVRVGMSLTDLCGGVYLFNGIVSVPYGYEKSQREVHVDIVMFDVTLSFLEHSLMAYVATGRSPQRLGNHYPRMAPFGAFNAQDKPITTYCGNDELFSVLCRALEPAELVDDPRSSSNTLRVQNQAILKQYTERTLKMQAAEVWLARIHEVGVPVAPLLSVAEAIKLP